MPGAVFYHKDCNLQVALAPVRELSPQRAVCTQQAPFRVAWPPSQCKKELLLEGLQGIGSPTHTGPLPMSAPMCPASVQSPGFMLQCFQLYAVFRILTQTGRVKLNLKPKF